VGAKSACPVALLRSGRMAKPGMLIALIVTAAA